MKRRTLAGPPGEEEEEWETIYYYAWFAVLD
jgi:hypothetical protein